MTRINLISVQELHYKHLLAEIRELPRIFSYVEKFGVNKNRISNNFTLNKGHILFFTNKLKFLFERYCLLHFEAFRRVYNINYSISKLYNKYNNLFILDNQINYTPKDEDIKISEERIKERLSKIKK